MAFAQSPRSALAPDSRPLLHHGLGVHASADHGYSSHPVLSDVDDKISDRRISRPRKRTTRVASMGGAGLLQPRAEPPRSRERNRGTLRRELSDNAQDLLDLPGVGRYTAAAILTFAFDQPVGIVEANTTRLLARLFNVTAPVDATLGREQLWKHANRIVPRQNAGEFNSALMDLGALVCLPQRPRCAACPVHSSCLAGDPSSLPRKKPRPATKSLTERHTFALRRGKVLLESCEHRWRGMWMLPVLANRPPRQPAYSSTFSFTHHRIRLEAFRDSHIRPSRQQAWFDLHKVDRLPMPNPHRRALRALLAGHQNQVNHLS